MILKSWQIAGLVNLLVGLGCGQIALARVILPHLDRQVKWSIAQSSSSMEINIDTPEKQELFDASLRLKTLLESGNPQQIRENIGLVEETLRLAEKTKNSRLIMNTSMLAGSLYATVYGENQKGINYLNRAAAIARSMKNPFGRNIEMICLIIVGMIQNQHNESQLALLSLSRASKLLQEGDGDISKAGKPIVLSMMGWAYNNSNNFSAGLELLDLALASLPEAEKILGLSQVSPGSPDMVNLPKIVAFWQKGVAYEKLGKPEKSLSLYNDALNFVKQLASKNPSDLFLASTLKQIQKSVDNLNRR
jgi:tetratricopeptide (TPR) repeat protein